MIDITPIILAIIALLLAVLVVVVIPFLKKKMGKDDFEKLYSVVVIAVRAAEQIFKATHPEGGAGPEKKQYVLRYLEDLGYSVDTEEINMMIENAVYEINQAAKGA